MSDTGSVLEVQLLRWNEGPNGRTVTFLLHEDTVQHPFRGLRTGPSNGQRLAIACSLIADDETTTPVDPPSTAPEKPKGGRRAREAGIACGEGAFAAYLEEKWPKFVFRNDSGDVDTRETVLDICGVNSRALFDHNEFASTTWDRVYSGYIAWREAP